MHSRNGFLFNSQLFSHVFVGFAGFKGEQRLGKTGFEERKLSDLDLSEVGGGGGDFGLDMPR